MIHSQNLIDSNGSNDVRAVRYSGSDTETVTESKNDRQTVRF